MKIKVIMTGGTVASVEKDGVINNNPKSDIVSIWLEKNPSETKTAEFIRSFPYSILSENISLSNWQTLLNELNNSKNVDGIIITHGSDTLSYTSAMVSIYCRNTQIPIVLTASDKVISDKTANGLPNFTQSVELIKNRKIGVWTVFDNVFSANSVVEADCFNDRFSDGVCVEMSMAVQKDIRLKKRVQMLKSYPFCDYSGTAFDDEVGAVLLVCYHSGTADEKAVLKLIEKCREKNISLFLQGLKSGRGIYSSADILIKNGAKALYDITPEYALAYITFLINQGKN